MGRKDLVLILGDTHLPWADPRAIKEAVYRAKHMQPTHIIQIGDLKDNYAFSRFYKTLESNNPAKELLASDLAARKLWRDLGNAAPRSKRFQLGGNHDAARLKKLVLQGQPELYSIVEEYMAASMTFDGVSTISDYRDYLELNINGQPTVFCHGWLSTTVKHLHFFKKSVVLGHLHRAEIQFSRQYGLTTQYAMNVGYMGDEDSPVFNYTQCVKKDWHLALGIIDQDGPRVITL